jgi:hypothetical protein
MQTSEKAEDFVEKLTNALYKRELRREKEARERLENDYKSGKIRKEVYQKIKDIGELCAKYGFPGGKIPKEVYQKIMHESILCSYCGFPIIPTTYGETAETCDREEALIICRHCLEVEI